jgi:hypothetical protein
VRATFDCFWTGIQDRDRRLVHAAGGDLESLAWSWTEVFEATTPRAQGWCSWTRPEAPGDDPYALARTLDAERFSDAWWDAHERRMWASREPDMRKARVPAFREQFPAEVLLALWGTGVIASCLEHTYGSFDGRADAAGIIRYLERTGQWRWVER